MEYTEHLWQSIWSKSVLIGSEVENEVRQLSGKNIPGNQESGIE